MRTVKDLKKYLDSFPDDYGVIFASDEEGNNYHPWSGDHSTVAYDSTQWGEDAIDFEAEQEDKNAIVLWP